ncbi:MAG: 2-oxoacid ferredoxin oxidoreductase [Candidatus Kerfeldbacteria bacterium CG08_land_8_20_14_0_20_43_14]|uniref:2-oxoacid ferredoxin oxidoreductase n=1 Tax=Candidatus Kerfeldbacteria bacterium CG08_land_8_20_14_0_20_43_14 TaxID=2014246 RepID=A0A2H0YPI8_9BACT|nr:MAG: 2-oxoacid ferredoxin oxidoreductase [Candidatus Kerfeldbacteria bacterium CG08_land_8_20_14_0_20_43_14]
MPKIQKKFTDYNTPHTPTWCPGCGNYGIWTALRMAVAELGWEPHEFLVVYGIGCSGNMANIIKSYGFHGLHGRALPVAIGAKLANQKLKVIALGGDGDGYGEGGNHFIHALRGNVDITYIVHDNQVYGLTKGQMAPTTEKGEITSSTPEGVIDQPINPPALAIAAGGTFVAQGFAGDTRQLTDLIKQGIEHPGFAHLNVLQPCVTFNHHNTFPWFLKRVYKLEEQKYQPNDKALAFKKALEWGDKIPTGVFYKEIRNTYEQGVSELKKQALIKQNLTKIDISKILKKYQ